MTTVPTAAPPRQYRGVRLDPISGLWAAHVSAGDHAGRLIGHFDRDYRAALAHDRVALFLGGAADATAAAINFPPSFSALELLFLRRRASGGFDVLLRAVRDEAYDAEFEGFLGDAFDEYRWPGAGGGAGDEEAARAVARCIDRVRWKTPAEWLRVARDVHQARHAFVMGHLNPVLCSSWVPFFHEGDPNRSFFTCEEAHEWEGARRRAAEREAAAAAAAQEVGAPEPEPEPGGRELEEQEQRRPDPASSHAMPRRRVSTPLRSIKRWLRRTCFFSFDEQICEGSEREQRVALLTTPRPCSWHASFGIPDECSRSHRFA